MTVTLELDTESLDSLTRRTLTSLSTALAKSKRVVVVTGAGISCSCGIPDFRSSDGLYALVKSRYPDSVLKGRDLFDASLFRDPTSSALFYTFMAELKASIDLAKPSPTHSFIKTLDDKGKLLRSYTQNIDGMEERAGLAGSASECMKSVGKSKSKSKIKAKEVRNVQLHGDIHRVRCTVCAADYKGTKEHLEAFREGSPPDCPECQARSAARVARSARPLKVGTLRPCIVLYDEPHPLGEEIGAIETADLARKPDMLVIMGTSLKVTGVKKLVREFARAVHEQKLGGGKVVFVNKTPPAGEWAGIIDYHIAGETDAWVTKVIADWKKARPQDWEVQTTLSADKNNTNAAAYKIVKRKTKEGKKGSANDENVPVAVPGKKPLAALPAHLPTPPLSPSKRSPNRSHYDEAETSPSKRRDILTNRPQVPESERGMLFAKQMTPPIEADISGPQKTKKSGNRPAVRKPEKIISAKNG